ncbi:hypothetical protein [Ulvibacterium sp.]|uniref:hypothetical protein n=1 Tax=Ulvibacterium sp. TaxID=2665914 RepID=UPI00260E0C08|nr:hypothetical protein [Ulvibacterium sp.]
MFLKPNDLASAMGIKPDTLRKHIQRKKLFRSGKVIDTEFPANHEYIMEQTAGKGLNLGLIPKDSKSSKQKMDILPTISDNPSIETPIKPKPSKHEKLGIQKKEAELLKIKKDTEFREFQLRKIQGKLLPVDLVERIFTVNIQTVFRSFETEAENVASIYCDILGGDSSHQAEMTKQMKDQLQVSIDYSKDRAAKEIKSAIESYCEVLSRGERK